MLIFDKLTTVSKSSSKSPKPSNSIEIAITSYSCHNMLTALSRCLPSFLSMMHDTRALNNSSLGHIDSSLPTNNPWKQMESCNQLQQRINVLKYVQYIPLALACIWQAMNVWTLHIQVCLHLT